MSAEPAFSPALEELLNGLRSIEELDLLLRLQREGRSSTALELATALGLSESVTVGSLQNLVLCRLVVQEGESSPLRYVFAPQRPELRAAVEELSRCYDEHRLDVLRVISNKALERVRSDARRAFGDPKRRPDPKRK